MKTRTPDLLGMSYACANMVHSPGYADDLRQYTTLNNNGCPEQAGRKQKGNANLRSWFNS